MDFALTQEQQMLQDSARRLLEKEFNFESRHPIIAKGAFDEAHWHTFAEMGWLGVGLPEECGGFGGNAVDTAVLMEEFGRVLLAEPVWAVAVLAAQTMAASGDAEKIEAILPLVASGEARPVLAHNEAEAGGLVEHVATRAERTPSGGWKLSGIKTLIIGGNVADRLIVSARTSGDARDRDGITLFLVKPDAPGLHSQAVRLVDNRWATHIDLDGVEVEPASVIGKVGQGYEALETGYAHGLLALCSEAIGIMEKSIWVTRDYLKIRKQFGQTLNNFQSLQHRMSEMLIELELSRGMVHRAHSLFEAGQQIRAQALAEAKVHIGHSGLFVCGQAIQLHGGIGVTEEYVIGHYFKRMLLIENAFGTSYFHLERLGDAERRRPLTPNRGFAQECSTGTDLLIDAPSKLTYC